MIDGLRTAFAFLTVVPVTAPADWERGARQASWFFAPVGLATGALTALVWWPLYELLGPGSAALAAVVVLMVASGGLHFDGWVDLADAVFAPVPPAQRLEILRDVRVGAYGVLAGMLLVLALWGTLLDLPYEPGWRALIVAAGTGGAAMVTVMAAFPYGRHDDGLGAAFVRDTGWLRTVAAWGTVGVAAVLLLGWMGLVAAGVAAAVALAAGWWLARRLGGGLTGDCYGAAYYLGLLGVLITTQGLSRWFALTADGVAVAIALALDLSLGQLPNSLHPVAWLGRLIALLYGRPTGRPRDLGRSAVATLGLVAVVGGVGAAAQVVTRRAGLLTGVLRGLMLSTLFSAFGLVEAAREVERALAAGDLPAARERLRALVSRDTAELDVPLVRSAVVESLAENLCDSVAAPLFAFAGGGLPAAAVYRAINTADAMVGYRGELEWLGKLPARLDDLLNLVPARLAAHTMLALAWTVGGSARFGGSLARRQARRTASPNAGWTIAAMAGILGVTLTKPDHYRLEGGPRFPAAADVARACRLVSASTLALGFAATLCAGRLLR